ncbi:WAP-type 'four-disulfide core' domain [Trinorchestia longiramus]|nr:WAP-type 'four-disulfide core' domain [Trinorchestia longiramus]
MTLKKCHVLLHRCQFQCPGSVTCCDGVSKPGFCPYSNKCLGSFPELQECPREDHACGGTEKCCWSECRRQYFCMPSVQNVLDHPGFCPAVSCSYNSSAADICRVDRDCTLDEKCCFDPCQSKRLCKRAEEKNHNAPTSRPSPTQCFFLCPNSRECCDNLERPGFCPRTNSCPNTLVSGSSLRLQECRDRSDFQCSAGEKCCWDPCQMKHFCRPSAPRSNEHAGTCPAVIKWCSPLVSARACASDMDCALDAKCCYDACKRSTLCHPTELRRPGCTRQCPGSKKCCDGEVRLARSTLGQKYAWPEVRLARSTLGQKYAWPEVRSARSSIKNRSFLPASEIKPGLCPASARCSRPTSASIFPKSGCTEDYDCSGALRCCRDPCSTAWFCSATVTRPFEHLGSCPSNISCSTPGTAIRRCSADIDCYSHEKCCTTTYCPSTPGFRLCFPARRDSVPIGPDGGSISNKPSGNQEGTSRPSLPPAHGCQKLCAGSKTKCCDDEVDTTCPSNTRDCSKLLTNKIKECIRHSDCEERELCCRLDCIRRKACITRLIQPVEPEEYAEKVNVSVIFTALSLTLSQFVTEQLKPVVEANKNQINLELIPYTVYSKGSCRYEPEDCDGHKYLACGYEVFPTLSLQYTDCFLNLLTNSINPARAANNCTLGFRVVLTELNDCVSGLKSESLIVAYRARQQELVYRTKPRKLPTVLVNGDDISPWRLGEKVEALLARD